MRDASSAHAGVPGERSLLVGVDECGSQDARTAIHPTKFVSLHGGMRGVAPSQRPQSADRKDDREQRGHANREHRPNEEKVPAVLAQVGANSRSSHVQDRNAQPKQRHEQDDDVPRSPTGQHDCSVQPNHADGYHDEI